MKKRVLRAIAPDGFVVTRRTHRDYAFAVLVERGGSANVRYGEGEGKDPWGAWSWNGRRDLAEKSAEGARRAWPGRRIEIVPVEPEGD